MIGEILTPVVVIFGIFAVFLGIKTTCYILAGCTALLSIAVLLVYLWVRRQLPPPTPNTIGFFHPFADGGGGGERVLWAAIQALQQSHPNHVLIIYGCLPATTPSSLVEQVVTRFNLAIQPTFRIIPLKARHLLLPNSYPRFTMFCQAMASITVALEGLKVSTPEIWVDTTGWAFPYPILRLAGSKVAAYVHYPTISTDMLGRVWSGNALYNNNRQIANSAIKTGLKLIYYHLFALVYGFVGACAQVVMVNSSWTRRHISRLWFRRHRPSLVYPPCDTSALQSIPLNRKLKRLYIISIAQFRPEKDHELQLQAFANARQRATKMPYHPISDAVLSARLQLIGGCRGPEDEERVEYLKKYAEVLGLGPEHVEFHVNVSFEMMRSLLKDAVVGLHTMVDEHFGISVVEYMAAGVVPIAHDSGGPREDIIVPEVGVVQGNDSSVGVQPMGLLCSSLESYSDAIIEVLTMDHEERLKVARTARKRAKMFSDERFKEDFLASMESLLGGTE